MAAKQQSGTIARRIEDRQTCFSRGDWRYASMSETTIKNIRTLFESIGQHSPLVEERMKNAGMNPDRAIVESVAKYWDALEKLAAE
jgi:hypothetical protein